jgi:hypothetical protein
MNEQTPSKEAVATANWTAMTLIGELQMAPPGEYYNCAVKLIQSAITSSTAPLEQTIRELEKREAEYELDCDIMYRRLSEYIDAKLGTKGEHSCFETIDNVADKLTTQQKALEFYGDEKNYYKCTIIGFGQDSEPEPVVVPDSQPVLSDRGAIARAALGDKK